MDHIAVADGTCLRIRDEGQGSAIVLVHGWKGNGALWDEAASALVARGHRVVRCDHRWMGESDNPGGPYDIDVLADDLRDVIGQLALQDVTLVGWSMGCTVSLRALEKGLDAVRALVLLNGPLRLVRAEDFKYAMTAERFNRHVDEIAESWPVAERAFQADSLLQENRPRFLARLVDAALQTPLPAVLGLVRSQALIDMREVIARLPIPVLAAYSDRDPYYPASLATYIADSAPSGSAHVFRASAHCTPLEETNEFADVVSHFARTH